MQSNPYQSLVSLLSNILEAYTTALFLVDPKRRLLNLVAAQSLSKFLPENVSLPLEQSGILSQVQKVGQTIHLEKLQDASSTLMTTLPFYREGESHIKGLLALPVGDGAGVLYVDTKYSWGFNDKQQKWIREIAGVLNELLVRQQCLTQQRDYARILEFWHRLDQATAKEYTLEDYSQLVVDETTRFLDTEYGLLALKNPNQEHYHILASTSNVPRSLTHQQLLVKQGLVGRVFRNKKILHITRLNPNTADHFLFTPSEGLSHQGTFLGLPVQTSLGVSVVLAFLSRKAIEWSSDDHFALSHMTHFFRLLLEQFYFKEECERLREYDLSSGVYNPLAFEARMEGILTSSMQTSTPFTLSLVQFEPWQTVCMKAPPRQVRQWQAAIAGALVDGLPQDAVIGQVAENRFSIILTGVTPQEGKQNLTHVLDSSDGVFAAKLKGVRLKPYVSVVGFPQDGTRSDELWSLAYRHLQSAFRSRIEKMNP